MNRELCIDCVDMESCQIRDKLVRPITLCKLYRARDRARAISPDENRAARSEGLCATCGIREECSRRQVEGGVWRCADYV